jgi:hypothetical protein
MVQRSLFILGRKPGVKSDFDRGVSSAHCPNCGAPENEQVSDACPFCGAVLNDGASAWVLLDVWAWSQPRAEALLAALRALATKELSTLGAAEPGTVSPVPAPVMTDEQCKHLLDLLGWVIGTAITSGDFDSDEQVLLGRVARERGITTRRLEAVVNAARSGEYDGPKPRDAVEAERWLNEAALVLSADGNISAAERKLIAAAAGSYNLSGFDLRMIFKRAQVQAYRDARDHLRQARELRQAG